MTNDIIFWLEKWKCNGQGDDYTTGSFLDSNYLKKYYKMIAIHLGKQQTLDADLKAIQQINFTGNLENQLTIFFIIEEVKESILDFSEATVKVFLFYFCINIKLSYITL